MDEKFAKQIASQLRKPEGEMGNQVAENMNSSNNRMNLKVIELMELKNSDNVLEVGMGNGFFAAKILNSGKDISYTGCDYSPHMVDIAKSINSEYIDRGNALFFEAEAHQLPFEDTVFDKALMVNTLYFYEQPTRELKEMLRVLKSGGRLVIGVRPKHIMELMPFTKYGFTLYNKEKLTLLLEDCGYTVVNIIEEEDVAYDVSGETMKLSYLVVVAVAK